MTAENEQVLPLGARLFPGIDLTLWLAITVPLLLFLALCGGAVALALT